MCSPPRAPGWGREHTEYVAPLIARAETCSSRRSTAARVSHPQQAFGIAAEDLDLVLLAERHGVYPFGPKRIGDERPVDRKHDAVDAHLLHAAQQRRIGEKPAGGQIEVIAEDIPEAERLVTRTAE